MSLDGKFYADYFIGNHLNHKYKVDSFTKTRLESLECQKSAIIQTPSNFKSVAGRCFFYN